MFVNQSYHEIKTPQYVQALLQCSEKKVCTNLAKAVNKSHDQIQRSIESAIDKDKNQTESLEVLAQSYLDKENIILVHDESLLVKLHAEHIEGVETSFDGSSGRPCAGIKMLTSLLTDTKINIPVDARPYASKELMQSFYKSKVELAIEVTKNLAQKFKLKRVLADAHFSTKIMLQFLHDSKLNYLMKIPRSRCVTINGKDGQLQNLLSLKKNNHFGHLKGEIAGIPCHFYVAKVKSGLTVYFISNDFIDTCKVIELYRIRWNIELFHRTAKQYLGLSECQMRSLEKQRQHAIYVMHAYAKASIGAHLMNLSCPESFINHQRNVKSMRSSHEL